MRKVRKHDRLNDDKKRQIICEIQRYARGEAGPKLTWKVLVEFSGFSKTALMQHRDIKKEFERAKEDLKNAPKNRLQDGKDFKSLEREVAELRSQVEQYKEREALWKARWQRIAYHVRQNGMQMHLVDRPAAGEVPGERESEVILRPFDKEIPSPR